MPPDLHSALTKATHAAAHLRNRVAELAHAVETDDAGAIVKAARALVSRDDTPTPPRDSPDQPEHLPEPDEGESS